MSDVVGLRACIMGHPVAQSRSPMLHGYWLAQHGIAGRYEHMDVAPDGFAAFFKGFAAAGFSGGNVTAPHKVAALAAVDRLDEAARVIGAVNTIWREGDTWVGGNTDAHGFIANLDELAPDWDAGARHAVVLGAGGAARAAIYTLRKRGLEVAVVNRTLDKATELAVYFNALPGAAVSALAMDDLASVLPKTDLLVNTTVLGMLGKPAFDIDISALKSSATVYDIVYVPLETGLLRQACARGHRVVGGLGMLLHQAVPGFQRWFGVLPTVTAELRQMIEDDIRAKTSGA